MGSMNSEQENTLNQILTCMDGLDTSNNGVIVMAATNRLVGLLFSSINHPTVHTCPHCVLSVVVSDATNTLPCAV